MAVSGHTCTVSHNGTTWTQVTSVEWTFAPGMPQSRVVGAGAAWTADAGSVTISNLGGCLPSLYGSVGNIQISGGGVNLTYKAILLGSTATAEVNGVTKYKTVFKLIS